MAQKLMPDIAPICILLVGVRVCNLAARADTVEPEASSSLWLQGSCQIPSL
eukprot:CAMPEP_0181411818 /NCGR_PEP_ID=MMETSP1110-20121109/8090_1 /TAXON_ID=174948 /ORGANISM="Symbiodinium sp., Strain CCMP421" /LENGTH=50 /DNA_ID=CAMNT_0023534487 /DNA_START=54 /DNA_END=206 /DNA_ORIENTATION=-